MMMMQRIAGDTVNCPKCFKVLHKCSLKKHMHLVHSRERPFLCVLCNKPFKLKHHRKNHILTQHREGGHTLPFVYRCTICGDVFDLGTDFVRHLDAHAKLLTPPQPGPDIDWSADFVDQMLDSEADTLGDAGRPLSGPQAVEQAREERASPAGVQGTARDDDDDAAGAGYHDGHAAAAAAAVTSLVSDGSCMTGVVPTLKQEERSLMDIIDNLKKEKDVEGAAAAAAAEGYPAIDDGGSTQGESNTEGNTSGESPDSSERAHESGFMSDPGPDLAFPPPPPEGAGRTPTTAADFQPLQQLERFASPLDRLALPGRPAAVRRAALSRTTLPSILHFQRKRHLPLNCPGCEKKFRCPADLRKHFLVHSGERNYTCGLCRKGFKLKHHLRSHMLMHIKSCNRVGNEWACVGCGAAASVSQIMLAKHMVNCCGVTSGGSAVRGGHKGAPMVMRRLTAPSFPLSDAAPPPPPVSLPAISLPPATRGVSLPSISLPPVSSFPAGGPYSYQGAPAYSMRGSQEMAPAFISLPSVASSPPMSRAAPNTVFSHAGIAQQQQQQQQRKAEARQSAIVSTAAQIAGGATVSHRHTAPYRDVVDIRDSPSPPLVAPSRSTPPGDRATQTPGETPRPESRSESRSSKMADAACDTTRDACSQTDISGRPGCEAERTLAAATFRCEPCGLHFEENAMYMIHRTLHGPDGDLQCSQCRQLFQDKYTYMGHLLNKFSH